MEPECEVLHTQTFMLPEGHPLAEGYDVVACGNCRFVYADTAADQARYDLFYRKVSKYEDDGTATGGGETPWDMKRIQETAELIASQLPGKDARVLDIGCANGGLLGYLKQLGCTNLVGLDPSPACAENVRNRHGIEAYVGTLSSIPESLGSFDCVILSHVAEHLRDLREMISGVKKLLGEGGQLYIEVPDATRYTEVRASSFNEFNTEHINHFSVTALTNLLSVCGFEKKADGMRIPYLAENTPFPAIYVIGTPTEANHGSIIPDERLVETIRAYIRKCSDDLPPSVLDELVETGEPVIVWGVGGSTTRLLANSDLAKANITAFVDNNPKYWGQTLMDKTVISPIELLSRSERIVITTRLHGTSIERQIVGELNYKGGIIKLYSE